MKSTPLGLVLGALALAVCAGAGATPPPPSRQGGFAGQCPKVTVSCSGTVARPGAPAGFSAAVEGAASGARLTFEWTPSAGTVASGQGTSNITVDTTGMAGDVTFSAAVEVGGLPPGCANRGSCETLVLQPFDPHPLDSYGKIKFADEQARLDNFAITLLDLPSMQGYVLCYGGRRERPGAAMARCARAKKYLVERRGLAPERLTLVDGGFQESLRVSLWVMPPGMAPTPAPGDTPGEVGPVAAPRRGAKAAAPRRARGARRH